MASNHHTVNTASGESEGNTGLIEPLATDVGCNTTARLHLSSNFVQKNELNIFQTESDHLSILINPGFLIFKLNVSVNF